MELDEPHFGGAHCSLDCFLVAVLAYLFHWAACWWWWGSYTGAAALSHAGEGADGYGLQYQGFQQSCWDGAQGLEAALETEVQPLPYKTGALITSPPLAPKGVCKESDVKSWLEVTHFFFF